MTHGLELGAFEERQIYRLVEGDWLIRGGYGFKRYSDEYEMAREAWHVLCEQKQFGQLIEQELLRALQKLDWELARNRASKQIEWCGEMGRVQVEDYIWGELKLFRAGVQVLGEPIVDLYLFPEYCLDEFRSNRNY